MYKVVPGAAGRHRRHHCLRLYFSSRGPRCSHCRNDSFARPQLQGAPLYTRRSRGVDTAPHTMPLSGLASPIHPSAHHTPRTWHSSPIRCVGPFCSVPPQEGRLRPGGTRHPQLLANLSLAVAAIKLLASAMGAPCVALKQPVRGAANSAVVVLGGKTEPSTTHFP
jgi:hypothetical protein